MRCAFTMFSTTSSSMNATTCPIRHGSEMSSVPEKKTEIPISDISNNSYQSWSQDRKETWWTPLTVCVKKQPFFRVILTTQTMHYYLGETLKFPKKIRAFFDSPLKWVPFDDPWFFLTTALKKGFGRQEVEFSLCPRPPVCQGHRVKLGIEKIHGQKIHSKELTYPTLGKG